MEKQMRYAALSVLSVFSIAAVSCSSGPEGTAEAFYAHLQNERWEKAADMGTQSTKLVLGFAQGMVEANKEKNIFSDKEIENIHCEELEGGNYHCQAITAEGDTTAPITLINRDGEWKVKMNKE